MAQTVITTWGTIPCGSSAIERMFDAQKLLMHLANDTNGLDELPEQFSGLAEFLQGEPIPVGLPGYLMPFGALLWHLDDRSYHLGIRFRPRQDGTGLVFSDWSGRANIPALCNLIRHLIPEALPYAFTWADVPFDMGSTAHTGGSALITSDGVQLLNAAEVVRERLGHVMLPPGTYRIAWHTDVEAIGRTHAAKLAVDLHRTNDFRPATLTVIEPNGSRWIIDPDDQAGTIDTGSSASD